MTLFIERMMVMKRVDNIFDEMISMDNLHEAMLMASKHKLDHKGVKRFCG